MIYKSLALALSIMATSYAEVKLPSRCNSAAVHKIELPVYHDQPTPTFTYRFSVSEREDLDAPLLIFVPGGPGQTSMEMPLSYPYDFSVVRTDPRGMGCNENPHLPTESLTSEAIAKDILAIIKTLKPKKYFIHGISYGTLVATMTASMAEAQNIKAPEAVILEGVIGRAYEADEYVNGTLERWKEVKAQLPLSLQKSLKKKIPFGLTTKEWSAWISAILINGTLPVGVDYAVDELMLFADSSRANELEGLSYRIKPMTAPPTEMKKRIYKQIACREFVPDVRDVKYDYDWVNGDLIATNDRLCSDTVFDKPFDSKHFQIKAPTYYFSGQQDPVTPPAQAQYHFDNQTGSKMLIKVLKGGHTALSTNLADCSNQLWMEILKGNQDEFKKALNACALKTSIHL